VSEALNAGAHPKGAYVFRLYLAGGAPNSVRALANLYAICQKYFPESHRIEVIDVLKNRCAPWPRRSTSRPPWLWFHPRPGCKSSAT
jgi:hypothetical protein